MTLAIDDAPRTTARRMTIEEFDSLPDGTRYELVHGERVERNVGNESDWIGRAIAFVLESFNQKARVGYVFGETDFVLDPDDPNHFRRPDASFVVASKFPDGLLPTGRATFAPDLAVEVLSPRDRAGEVDEKIQEYRRLGVRLIWIVYPRSRTVHIYRPTGNPEILTSADTITGEDVLPGFSSPVAEFFPKPLPVQPSGGGPQNPQ